jgi:hypothetical protein
VDENLIPETLWNMYAQCEDAIGPMKKYSTACQTADFVAHEDLFWEMSTIHASKSPFLYIKISLSP